MDWKISLNSFEDHILVLRNLINFALASPLPVPPRLLFTSSIGVIGRALGVSPIAEAYVQPENASENGYCESKWVGERLLELASEKTPLRPIVVRLGQVAGSPSGTWNDTEWLPSLVKSSIYLKALPSEDKVCSSRDPASRLADAV